MSQETLAASQKGTGGWGAARQTFSEILVSTAALKALLRGGLE